MSLLPSAECAQRMAIMLEQCAEAIARGIERDGAVPSSLRQRLGDDRRLAGRSALVECSCKVPAVKLSGRKRSPAR